MSDNKSKYSPAVIGYLNAISEFFGSTITPNEDDCINLAVENENPVTIHIDMDKEQFDLFSIVADELPDPIDYSLVQDLLDYALSPFVDGGPAVGRDPQTGFLEAYVILPFKNMSPAEFIEALKEFIKFQIAISHRIAENSENEAESSASMPETFISMEV